MRIVKPRCTTITFHGDFRRENHRHAAESGSRVIPSVYRPRICHLRVQNVSVVIATYAIDMSVAENLQQPVKTAFGGRLIHNLQLLSPLGSHFCLERI